MTRDSAMRVALLASMIMLATMANATYLQIVGPVSANLTGGRTIALGKVGPGESFYVLGSAQTTNASGKLINIGWDELTAVSLPQGWSAQQSPLYENPMKMKITVDPLAQSGTYHMVLRAVNVGNYSRLGNLTFNAYVNVSLNVFDLNVSPRNIQAGPGQPVDIKVEINNTGISDDPFVIRGLGLPAWNKSIQVISLHGEDNRFVYPVYINEPGFYRFNITVNSSSSSLISKSYAMGLTVNESLLNDYSAIGQGIILSPIVYEPAYAVMSLVSYLYSLIR